MLLYRMRYSLPLGDPRLGAVTLEEIRADLEVAEFLRRREGEAGAGRCPSCGTETYRARCPFCLDAPEVVVSVVDELLQEEERSGQLKPWEEWERALGNRVSQDG